MSNILYGLPLWQKESIGASYAPSPFIGMGSDILVMSILKVFTFNVCVGKLDTYRGVFYVATCVVVDAMDGAHCTHCCTISNLISTMQQPMRHSHLPSRTEVSCPFALKADRAGPRVCSLWPLDRTITTSTHVGSVTFPKRRCYQVCKTVSLCQTTAYKTINHNLQEK